jgi:hypothetical protein
MKCYTTTALVIHCQTKSLYSHAESTIRHQTLAIKGTTFSPRPSPNHVPARLITSISAKATKHYLSLKVCHPRCVKLIQQNVYVLSYTCSQNTTNNMSGSITVYYTKIQYNNIFPFDFRSISSHRELTRVYQKVSRLDL